MRLEAEGRQGFRFEDAAAAAAAAIMISALRRCSVSHSIGCGRFRAVGKSCSRSSRSGTGRAPFELLDEDIEERFVKGSGPGGQKINKVRNCVQLTHIPSGVSVSCQDSRELHANRHIARKRLKEKVEFQLKGDDSKVGRRISKIRNKKARSQRRARLKHQGAAAGKAGQEAAAPKRGTDKEKAIGSDATSDSCDHPEEWEQDKEEESDGENCASDSSSESSEEGR